MLMSATRHAFVVSADEIMFLKFDIIQKQHYPDDPKEDPTDVFVEAHLMYSTPIKLNGLFDEDSGEVPVKMALLYLMHCVTLEGWQMEEDLGNSMKYATKTKWGENYRLKLDFLGPKGELKTIGNYSQNDSKANKDGKDKKKEKDEDEDEVEVEDEDEDEMDTDA
jgi:hypothetical protein